MLKDHDAIAIVATADIERARRFYRDVLGLSSKAGDETSVLTFVTGRTKLVVYPSQEAGSNRANAVVWSCGDAFDRIIEDLVAKGVVFEHYPQMPGIRMDGDVHVDGSMRLAWFKDPDGNVLHVNNF